MISYSFKDDVWRIFHPSKVKVTNEKRRNSVDDLKKIEENNKEIDRRLEDIKVLNKKLDEKINQISKFIDEAEKAINEAEKNRQKKTIPLMTPVKKMTKEEELKMYEAAAYKKMYEEREVAERRK